PGAHGAARAETEPIMKGPIAIYGIKNCDTMKKARAWLDGRGVAYRFHDYKSEGVERDRLEGWTKMVGWEALLNRNGTTFRKLSEDDKSGIDAQKALALMTRYPSLIKRPVVEVGKQVIVGFNSGRYEEIFGG
ncbi:MAG TPA: ArsC family reductase, partial [Rhizomicrobium sp.]|nr:ArsC family reductase [Rhizomicrobium sp.]